MEAVTDPGVGVPEHVGIFTSCIPMTGVVPLLVVPSISVVIPEMGVPAINGRFAEVTCNLRSLADTNVGDTFFEFAFPPNAVVMFATVVLFVPS